MNPGSKAGFVAIIGRPNVGKSTLLNHLLGQKVSIVSPKPQTTRFRILGIKTGPGGQMVFVDTPGVHPTGSPLSRELSRIAIQALEDSDLMLWLVEAHLGLDEDDRFLLERIREVEIPKFLVLNKIDLLPRESLLPIISSLSRLGPFAEIVPISALKGDNLDRLEKLIFNYLPEGPPLFPQGQVTDQTERLLSAEFIREKIFQLTHQEVPYSAAVVVDDFKENREKNLVTIEATIYVEKESQKGILIGKDGQALKRIGRSARIEIENMVGARVFLRLWVKVKKDWRRDRAAWRQLGYGSG